MLEEGTGGCGWVGSSEVDGVYSWRWGFWSATAMDLTAELVSPFPQGDKEVAEGICLCGKGVYPFNKARLIGDTKRCLV